MAFGQAAEELRRNFMLTVVPVLMDLVSFSVVAGLGIYSGSLASPGPHAFNLKVSLPSVPPSIGDILEVQLLNFNFNPGPGTVEQPHFLGFLAGVGILGLLAFAAMFLLGTFVEGGFLGSIKKGLQRQSLTLAGFFEEGRYYWKRLILLKLLFIGVAIVALIFVVPMVAILRVLGALVLGIGLLVVAFLLLFVEYALVDDDLEIIPALGRSVEVVKSNIGAVLGHVLGLLVLLAVAGAVINGIAMFSFLLAIFTYAPVGTYGVLVLYLLYRELKVGTNQ